MANKEKCFVFYERWYTQLQRLPPEEKLKMYEAICKYAFGIETEEMAYYLESLMDNIRIAIDNDKIRQEAYLEQRRKAIASRWKKKKGEHEGVRNDTSEEENIKASEEENVKDNTKVYGRIQPNTTEYEGVRNDTSEYNNENKNKNKNENENKNKNKNEVDVNTSTLVSNETNIIKAKAFTSTASVDAQAEEAKVEIVKSEEEIYLDDFCKKVAYYFNEKMQGKEITKIRQLTSARKASIKARLKESSETEVFAAIDKTSESDFLNGCGNRGFKASFDWLFRPRNFIKVLEGNYDNNRKNKTSADSRSQFDPYTKRRGFDVTATSAEEYSERL